MLNFSVEQRNTLLTVWKVEGIRPADAMRLEPIDPMNNQAIHQHYSTTVVDVVAQPENDRTLA